MRNILIMKILKSYKFRLYPNSIQEQELCQHAGNTRFVWNKLLEYNQKYFKENKKYIFSYDMITSLPKIKEEFEFLRLSAAQSLQQVGLNLDKAIKHSIKKETIEKRNQKIAKATTEIQRIKAYDYGKPKFKKKKCTDSFKIVEKFHINKHSITLPKIGKVKCVKHRKLEGKPKFLTISKDNNQWFCSITTEINLIEKPLDKNNIVGIDVGLKEFATLSDDTTIKRERFLNKYTKKLKREQRHLSRKTKGSKNRVKQIKKVHNLHRKIKNQRKEFLHKVTSNMIAKYSGFILEDLSISNMMKNHKLARNISDVSWYEFNRMLEYKSLWNFKYFVKVDRFFASSKICNNCNNKKVDLTLKDRIYKCEKCGNIIDRDYNASKNILEEGLRIIENTAGHAGINACGDERFRANLLAQCSSKKQEKELIHKY